MPYLDYSVSPLPICRKFRYGTVLAVFFSIIVYGQPPRNPVSDPYHDGRKQELQYPGYGKEEPDPSGLTEVRIAYFGPSDPNDPAGGDIWLATQLAVEEANAGGGYKGIPFRLLPAWSASPWSTGISDLTRLVFEQHVWAIIGSIDGPSTHLVEQVVTKALVTLINPASTDETVNYAFVPWMFSLPPSDRLHANALSSRLQASGERLVVIAANDHDSHVSMTQFTAVLETHGVAPARIIQIKAGSGVAHEAVMEALRAEPESILLCAGAIDSATVLHALRSSGYRGLVYGGASMGRRLFLERAGADSEGVIFPLIYDPSPAQADFSAKFQARFRREPDFTAAHAYDASRLLLQAVSKAGLNRARIREAVRQASPWQGTTGVIEWDALGQNKRPVRLGTIRGGRVQELKHQKVD